MTKKVYLSGGTVSDWQDRIMEHLLAEPVEFYNPKNFKLGPMVAPEIRIFGPMDMNKIKECDILFAYLEKTNPTPVNIALELGYAKGLGKITVLCNEWTPEAYEIKELKTMATTDPNVQATWFKPHYVDLLNQWADFFEPDFGIAVELLKRLITYDGEKQPTPGSNP